MEALDFKRKVDLKKVLIMLTIPLTEKRYLEDLHYSKRLFRRKRPKEYIQIEVLRLGEGWDRYQKDVVRYILQDLKLLDEQMPCTLDYDVRFLDFHRAYQSGQYEVIFLLAHHIEEPSPGYIEFADGGVSMLRMLNLLRTTPKGSRAPLFFVCSSQRRLEQAKLDQPNTISYIATSEGKIMTVQGFTFLKEWILAMPGQTLQEAYARAIDRYLHN